MALPKTESAQSVHTRIETLVALSRLLDRVDASTVAVGAEQYRGLVQCIQEALGDEIPQPVLEAILSSHPGTAEIYENAHYGESGLSRSPLEQSVATEMLAAQAIARAARKTPA